ncbi:MAG: phosphotyrosine protein phosphatase [Candidatus Dojkabacteria bacterium]
MKKFLFICGKNKLRSPTAEFVFSDYNDIETRSAGINNDAEYIVSSKDIEWSDYIFLMEKKYKVKLKSMFSDLLKNKKIVILNIPDIYGYMDPKLIKELKVKMQPWISVIKS